VVAHGASGGSENGRRREKKEIDSKVRKNVLSLSRPFLCVNVRELPLKILYKVPFSSAARTAIKSFMGRLKGSMRHPPSGKEQGPAKKSEWAMRPGNWVLTAL